MPRIRNFSLPAALTEELVHVAEEFPPDLIVDWGRAVLSGGFTKQELVRERMIARFRSEGSLDPITLDMLSCEAPYRETVSALTLPALQNLFVPACVLATPAAWLLALLLDPREEVFKWAVELASKPVPNTPATEDEIFDAEELVKAFACDKLLWEFGIELSSTTPEELPPPDVLDAFAKQALEDSRKQVSKQSERIQQLTNELQQQKQRHQAKLKELSDAAEREKKSFYTQLAAIREHEQKLLKEKQTLEHKLAEAAKQNQAVIAQRVQEQTSAVVRKWLEPAREVEAALAEATRKGANLEARAAELLDAQARQDRHTGNRLELETRLQSIVSIRERANNALQSAIVPVPELKGFVSELDAEIEKLRTILSPGKVRSDTASRLLSSINAVASWDELRNLSQLLDQLAEASLIPAPETRDLYAAIQRKFSLFDETQKQRGGEPDTGWSLREVLYRNKPALLVLDGHNLLFNLTDLFQPFYENEHPGRNARQRLVEVVRKLVHSRQNVQTKLCFDGPLGTSDRVSPNLEVVYSGGTGSNRADEVIVTQLQFKDLKSLDQKVFVVTDDREIRKQILQTGAKFVRNDLFAVFLKDFGALS